MTFLVNTDRNNKRGSTGRFGLVSMVSLVLLGKMAALLTGAAPVPGGPSRQSTEITVGISSGLPINAGAYTMTPLGALWSRIVNWHRDRAVIAQPDDEQTEQQAASAVLTSNEAGPSG